MSGHLGALRLQAACWRIGIRESYRMLLIATAISALLAYSRPELPGLPVVVWVFLILNIGQTVKLKQRRERWELFLASCNAQRWLIASAGYIFNISLALAATVVAVAGVYCYPEMRGELARSGGLLGLIVFANWALLYQHSQSIIADLVSVEKVMAVSKIAILVFILLLKVGMDSNAVSLGTLQSLAPVVAAFNVAGVFLVAQWLHWRREPRP